MKNKHTFRLLIDPRPGIMLRVGLVLERRSFSVVHMDIVEDAYHNGLHEMTVKAFGEDIKLEQIIKQLEKMIDVSEVELQTAIYQETNSYIKIAVA
jgi:acetolactate synthase small subunit